MSLQRIKKKKWKKKQRKNKYIKENKSEFCLVNEKTLSNSCTKFFMRFIFNASKQNDNQNRGI